MKPTLFLLIIILLPVIACAQNRYDIVIDEVMADPTPQTGLPNNEWIELKNTTNASINLQNWRIGDATSQSGPMPNFTLQPDSFVVVCASSAVVALSAFGAVIPVTSFPSLDNDGDQLFLKAPNGMIIHAISYSLSWYQNELKKEGGWTLEMIDTRNPCSGISNWKASTHIAGGTPGKKNTVDATNNDQTAPEVKKAYTTDNTTIILVFDEPVDSLKGAAATNYTIDGGLNIVSAVTLPPLFNTVQLKTNNPLAINTVYHITVEQVTDCKNNMISTANTTRVGLPVDPVPGEWIINEILFNPRPNGYDYVECYNNSNSIFDASQLYLANRNSSGVTSSIKALSATPVYIFPGDYIVVTEDADNLAMNYLVKNPGNILVISSLPSFPDEEGTTILLNFQGAIVDEVNYKKNWHFKLVANDEGVSLERIDPAAASQDETNWHSAASTAGYGTPAYKNSQYRQSPGIAATIEASKIFSPDNDGLDDIASIQYKMDALGYVANVILFDAAGRPVRNLVRNGILGLSGYWNWDGLDDKGKKLPVGPYIIFTEIFTLQGKKERFKQVVILARKLN